MLSGERKKFCLRTTRKPMLVGGLSNTVIVYENSAPYYCHIAFDQSFADAVGSQLPRGVSTEDLAFIQVMFDRVAAQWVVSACYVADWEQQVLWMSETKPAWVKELKIIRYNNHEHSKDSQGRTASHPEASARARKALASASSAP